MVGTVRLERDGPVGWAIIDNPERRNALTAGMFGALSAGLAELDADDGIRVLVLRGAGTRAFASGADIGDLGSVPRTTPRGPLVAATKPIVAMIHGSCLGGGLLVALGADIRICADDARFAIPAIRLGVAYPYDGVRRLVAVAGVAAAISEGAPLSVHAAKASIGAALAGSPSDAVDDVIRACWASEDLAEGRQAFAEKRPPVWRGR